MRTTKVHPRSLTSIFIVRCLDSIICILTLSEVSGFWPVSVAEQAGLNLTWSKISEDTFLRDVAHISIHRIMISHFSCSSFWCRRRAFPGDLIFVILYPEVGILWRSYLCYLIYGGGHSLEILSLLSYISRRTFPGDFIFVILYQEEDIPWRSYICYLISAGGHSLEILSLLSYIRRRTFPGDLIFVILNQGEGISWRSYLCVLISGEGHSM